MFRMSDPLSLSGAKGPLEAYLSAVLKDLASSPYYNESLSHFCPASGNIALDVSYSLLSETFLRVLLDDSTHRSFKISLRLPVFLSGSPSYFPLLKVSTIFLCSELRIIGISTFAREKKSH